jgi:hypothetical protein
MQRRRQRPREASKNALRTAAALWWAGAVDALQLQRAVVYCVLDESGVVASRLAKSFLVNGAIYGLSVAWHARVALPAAERLLVTYAAPVYGADTAAKILRCLDVLVLVAWLAPAYGAALVIGSTWCQEVADAAVDVNKQRRRQQQGQQQQQQPDRIHDSSSGGGGSDGGTAAANHSIPLPPLLSTPTQAGSGGSTAAAAAPASASAFEGVAAEAYRSVFLAVFTAEVMALGLLPGALGAFSMAGGRGQGGNACVCVLLSLVCA